MPAVLNLTTGNGAGTKNVLKWNLALGFEFSIQPAVLKVTTGNGAGTKNVLKWNLAPGFEFSIQSSVYGATTVAKVNLCYTWTRCTVSFYSM